jgi:hypothetical protein
VWQFWTVTGVQNPIKCKKARVHSQAEPHEVIRGHEFINEWGTATSHPDLEFDIFEQTIERVQVNTKLNFHVCNLMKVQVNLKKFIFEKSGGNIYRKYHRFLNLRQFIYCTFHSIYLLYSSLQENIQLIYGTNLEAFSFFFVRYHIRGKNF